MKRWPTEPVQPRTPEDDKSKQDSPRKYNANYPPHFFLGGSEAIWALRIDTIESLVANGRRKDIKSCTFYSYGL